MSTYKPTELINMDASESLKPSVGPTPLEYKRLGDTGGGYCVVNFTFEVPAI